MTLYHIKHHVQFLLYDLEISSPNFEPLWNPVVHSNNVQLLPGLNMKRRTSVVQIRTSHRNHHLSPRDRTNTSSQFHPIVSPKLSVPVTFPHYDPVEFDTSKSLCSIVTFPNKYIFPIQIILSKNKTYLLVAMVLQHLIPEFLGTWHPTPTMKALLSLHTASPHFHKLSTCTQIQDIIFAWHVSKVYTYNWYRDLRDLKCKAWLLPFWPFFLTKTGDVVWLCVWLL